MSQLKTLQGIIVTHILKSQGHCQQARNTARHHSHSQAGEPRTGIVSRLEKKQGTTVTHQLESQEQALSACQKHSKAGTTATHFLDSQGQALSAGQKHSKASQPLTSWRAKDRHCQQARNTVRHHSHSLSGEPRTGIVSRLETQQGTTATCILKSQGQAFSAGYKHSKAPQLLTYWRAKDRHCQQTRNIATHHSYSHTSEPSTGVIRSFIKNVQVTSWYSPTRSSMKHDQALTTIELL